MWPAWYRPPLPPMHARRIVSEVARAFGMTPEEVCSRSRKRRTVLARGVAIRILRDCRRDRMFRYSTTQIAKIVNRDHSTVIHALQTFPVWMDYDPEVHDTYQTLRSLAA